MTFYRLFVASLFLICFCKKGFLKGIFANNKKLLFGVAIFGNVLPFNLISLSEIYVESIVAASLIGTMPLFTYIIAYFISKNKSLDFISIIGLLFGFIGMLIFINPFGISLESVAFSFSLLIILSAFFYGLSANFVKEIQDNSPIEIAAFTTILAMLLAFPIFILNFISLNNFEKQLLFNISFESFLSATVLGIVCTGFAILIFFNLIKIKSAVFASQSNFLIPCFGSLWGYIFLDENLTENMIYGLLLIVIGGWVTNRSMFVKSN